MVLCVFSNIGFHNEGSEVEKFTVADRDSANYLLKAKYYRQLFEASMEVYGGLFFITVNTFMGNLFNTLLVF